MKKKTIILLISIVLAFVIGLNFNFNYAAAGDYYTDLTQYTSSDINDKNAVYIADLAKAYMQANPQLCSESIILSDSLFNYCYICVSPYSFAIYFAADSSYFYTDSSDHHLGMNENFSRVLAITSYNNFAEFYCFTFENVTESRVLFADINGHNRERSSYYMNFDTYDINGTTIWLYKNFNYTNTVQETIEKPTFYYDIQDSDLGYKIAITPLNIECPYTLKCYFDDNYDNFYTLQDNSVVMTTSNFIVNKNVKKLLFVCEHPTGSLSLEVKLDVLYGTVQKPYLTVNTVSGSDVNGAKEYDYSYITAYNLQDNHRVYWSTENSLESDNYIDFSNSNEYRLETFSDKTYITFFITNENGTIIYKLVHNKTTNKSTTTEDIDSNFNDYSDITFDEAPTLPEDAEVLDYIVYIFNMIGWGISQLLSFLKNIMSYVLDIGSIFAKCFNFFPSPIPQLFTIGILSVIVISIIKIIRK